MAQNQTNNGDEWGEEITAESQIVMESMGDEFIGTFNGLDTTPDGRIWQGHFTLEDGTDAFINAGYDLKRKLEKCAKGLLTKVRWISETEMGEGKNAMRVYDVRQKKG